MHLFDLPANIPWLSLIWLSMLVPSVVIPFISNDHKNAIRIIGTAFMSIAMVLSLLLFMAYDPARGGFQFVEHLDWIPQLGIGYFLGADGINLPMLVLNGLISFTGALMSWNIATRVKEYWVLLLVLTLGVYGVFMSLDLFLFFVFYELAVLPVYIMIGVWGSTNKEYGAMKLTLYLMTGSAFIIIGMLAIYFGSGLRTFDILALARNVTFSRAFQDTFFLPLFIGFAVLASMFPFHSWSPIGYSAAPTTASMMHAGVLKNLGAYGCLRVAIWLMPQGATDWLWVIAGLTLVNVVYGATIALVQRDFKYMLGYSSISHMGLVMLGLTAGNQIGLVGAVLQMFAHGIMTGLLFAVVGRMIYERTHTRQLPELSGIAKVMPFAAAMFVVGGLSSMGMPGLAGFWAEFNIFLGLWDRFPLVAAIAALSIPITAAYILRVIYQVFFSDVSNRTFFKLPKLTWQEYSGAILLAVILIGIGIYPAVLTEMINGSVTQVVQSLNASTIAGR